MSGIPKTINPPLVRTDFSNEKAWQEIVAEISRENPDGFSANVEIIDNAALAGANPNDLADSAAGTTDHAILFVVDAMTMASGERPILCVALVSARRTLRVVPGELWSIENNLSLGNMDFDEFAGAADADGIFRGF